MSSLAFMSDLEELVIHSARPSSLGAKVFQSLVIHPVHTTNMGTISSPGQLGAPLCPSLRRFRLKYDRWLRRTEQFDLFLVLASFIQSRAHSNYALESFDLWTTSEQRTRVELIERSQMSVEGFKRLVRVSVIKGDLLDFTAMKVNPKPSGESFLPADALSSQETHPFDIPHSTTACRFWLLGTVGRGSMLQTSAISSAGRSRVYKTLSLLFVLLTCL